MARQRHASLSSFTLPTNSPPTHQPHLVLSYPSKYLYFGTNFEPFKTLYYGTEGVVDLLFC
jgi:hypothetical protein